MKIKQEFLDLLGSYVYAYVDEGDEMLEFKDYIESDSLVYIGKGNGNRCLNHTKEDTKGLDINSCYIIGRNLEYFDSKSKDGSSFSIESLLIKMISPKKNSVSGHKEECFPMERLTCLYSDWLMTQRNMRTELNDFIDNNNLEDIISEARYKSTTWAIESGYRNGIKIVLSYDYKTTKARPFEWKINVARADRSKFDKDYATIYSDKLDISVTDKTVSFYVETEEEAIEIYKNLVL